MKNKLIILSIFIICIVLVLAGVALGAMDSREDTSLISNNYNVITDDNFIATLSDSNGNKLINKTITFTVTDSNNKSKVYNVTTDANGIATLDVKLCAGNYSIMGNFTGDNTYKSSNFCHNLTVTSKTQNIDSSSSLTPEEQGYTWSPQFEDYIKLRPDLQDEYDKDYPYPGGYVETIHGEIKPIG